MLPDQPLSISRSLLTAFGTRLLISYADRVPETGSIVVVSNHRSFMDAPLLMVGINRSIRFACHHYMGQVPVMREIVQTLGCFPLGEAEQRQQSFFQQAIRLLQGQQTVGLFPEGAQPMVRFTDSQEIGTFQRGFAHLALKAPIQNLVVLPVAIAPQAESISSAVPLRLLSLFDPSEPLFQQEGWHPLVLYRRVHLLMGRPYWITASQREHYQGKGAKAVVAELTNYCHTEINDLLRQGSY